MGEQELKVDEKTENAVELIAEAARLHRLLQKESTESVVVAALEWRYGNCGGLWVRKKVYAKALRLLDSMMKR